MNRSIKPHFFLFLGLLLAACSSLTSPQSDSPSLPDTAAQEWPTKDWRTSPPEEQGIDPQTLAEMAARAQDMRLHSLLVVRNGFLVHESYYAGHDQDTRHELYSVTKSFTGTLVGIAVDQGLIASIQNPVLEYFPDLEIEAKNDLTVTHLLTMTTGLDWDEGDPVYRAMYISPDWVEYVLEPPMRRSPGEEFNYCSGCSHVLAAIVQQVAGENLEKFAQSRLFKPLGITRYDWDSDSLGIPIGGWGLQITPREMAKLGYLYLNNGNWDGQQIVSAGWIEAATQIQAETGGDWAYGYQWWIDEAHAAYAARGRFGQLIYVLPDLNLIVVSTAAAEGDEALIQLIEELLLPNIQP